MQHSIKPAAGLKGSVRLPGDKSISHRYAMIASVAEGVSVIENYSSGADCQSTLACLRALGIEIEKRDRTVTIHGRGLDGFRAPAAGAARPIGCGQFRLHDSYVIRHARRATVHFVDHRR